MSAKEWGATILVILGCAVLVRLGLWQLDRHEQRQAFNASVRAQQILPPLELDDDVYINLLEDMEYRAVKVSGVYNFEDQIALRNQVWENNAGVHLVTPLNILDSDKVVLVDRGWVPLEDAAPENWAQYDLAGPVVVEGVIRRSTIEPEIGSMSDPVPGPGEPDLKEWNLLTVGSIDHQVQGDLLPIYVQQGVDPSVTTPPFPTAAPLELSDGPHLGYAGQWFLFALILGIGYPIYLHRQKSAKRIKSNDYIRESKHI